MTTGTDAKDGGGGPAGGRKLLLAVAAPAEARAIAGRDVEEWVLTALSPWVDLVRTGVGKSNAAGAVARLCDPGVHGTVVSIGIAGTYGGADRLLGVEIATQSLFADEGVQTSRGFEDLAGHGFPPWKGPGASILVLHDVSAWLAVELRRHLPATGPIATVSVCSGTHELVEAIVNRTGARAEAMEGAAVGASAARLGVDFGEVRVISNTTGDRDKQQWDLRGSLEVLGKIGRALIEAAPRLGERKK